MENAVVLSIADSAWTITFHPLGIRGIACCWITVGFSKSVTENEGHSTSRVQERDETTPVPSCKRKSHRVGPLLG